MYFTSVFKRFRELDPKVVPTVMTRDEPHTISVSMEKIIKMAELKVLYRVVQIQNETVHCRRTPSRNAFAKYSLMTEVEI